MKAEEGNSKDKASKLLFQAALIIKFFSDAIKALLNNSSLYLRMMGIFPCNEPQNIL